MRKYDERIRVRLKMDLFAYPHGDCAEKADQISGASVLSGLPESLLSCDISAWLYNPCVFCKFVV